ncbi:MAG: tetratricopeptide repeat protein [Pseudomonadota bacterium]
MQQEFQQAVRALGSGHLDEAEALIEGLLRQYPDHPEVRHLAGVVFFERGELARGRGMLDAALAQAPTNPELHYNYGSALLKHGDLPGALERFDHAVDLAPGHASAWNNRGTTLRQLGRSDEARNSFRGALDAAPGHPGALTNLGQLDLEAGDPNGALAQFERALASVPTSIGARVGRAEARLALGRVAEALAELREVCAGAPDRLDAWQALARAATEAVEFEQALAAARRVCELTPTSADAWNNLGSAATSLGDLEAAEEALKRAIELDPTHREATVNLAALLELANRTDEALAIATGDADDDRLRLTRARCLVREGAVEEARALLTDLRDHEDRWLAKDARFSLGKLLDRAGETAGAWEAYAAGNRLAGELWFSVQREPDSFLPGLDAVDRVLGTDLDWLKRATTSDARPPAFLFGFQRSGTTLLDTVLGVHPDVTVMEEQPVVNHVIAAIHERFGPYPEILPRLTGEQLEALRGVYRAEAERLTGGWGNGLLLDKSPLHTVHLALIRLLFPEAPLVLALRHPLDVCLSCFQQDFTMSPFMTNFLTVDGVARVYRQVFDLWWAIEPALGPSTHVIRYEDLVEDKESELRRLVTYLGLDWNEALLDHTGSARDRGLINTPSYEQVTRPIYRSAMGRWKRYAEPLETVRAQLARYIQRLGYEA